MEIAFQVDKEVVTRDSAVQQVIVPVGLQSAAIGDIVRQLTSRMVTPMLANVHLPMTVQTGPLLVPSLVIAKLMDKGKNQVDKDQVEEKGKLVGKVVVLVEVHLNKSQMEGDGLVQVVVNQVVEVVEVVLNKSQIVVDGLVKVVEVVHQNQVEMDGLVKVVGDQRVEVPKNQVEMDGLDLEVERQMPELVQVQVQVQ